MRKVSALFLRQKSTIAFLVALGFVLFLHGAIPFVTLPTLGQAVWCMGFSESFANDSVLTIHSHYFGYPTPAAISMGLSVAYPAGLLIRAGVHAADAYAIMAAVCLSLAFFGAFSFAKLFGLKMVFSVLVAILWMSMPIIWAHAGYSSLSLGIALIPLYIFLACRVFAIPEKVGAPRVIYFIAYIGICIISVFMDGYSFIVFAVAASFLIGYAFLRFNSLRRYLVVTAFPVHIASFGIAVLLYMLFIGGSLYEPAHLNFFRGWGLDLTFITIPTKGIHWFWDAIHLSVSRSSEQFFGDASVWISTFSLPLMMIGLLSWWQLKSENKLAHAFLILALLGLYLAMGPSVKIASTKPEPMGPLMPAELALAPTGNAFLYKYIPGFNNMRAVYRWSALMFFSFWALLVVRFSSLRTKRNELLIVVVIIALVISSIPHIQNKWASNVDNRESFYRIDSDLVALLDCDLEEGELIVFLPYRNDFLVNYIAPKLEIRTYNVGGDKNLATAREHWPEIMRQFRMGEVDSDFADRILLLLVRREADAVVLPFIDMLWAAHIWPALAEFRDELTPVIADLQTSGIVDVQERDYYAVVRIMPDFHDELESGVLEQTVAEVRCITPRCLRVEGWKLGMLPSQVGYYEDGSLHSDMHCGFLSFGPYLPMNAGEYCLVVRGSASSISTAWVDVVSGQGRVQHERFSLSPTKRGGTDVLISERVHLGKPVDDIEVRIYVGVEDEIRLDGYELTPVDITPVPSAEN